MAESPDQNVKKEQVLEQLRQILSAEAQAYAPSTYEVEKTAWTEQHRILTQQKNALTQRCKHLQRSATRAQQEAIVAQKGAEEAIKQAQEANACFIDAAGVKEELEMKLAESREAVQRKTGEIVELRSALEILQTTIRDLRQTIDGWTERMGSAEVKEAMEGRDGRLTKRARLE